MALRGLHPPGRPPGLPPGRRRRSPPTGNVEVVDPKGTRFVADHVDVTGDFKQAFVRSLTLTTADGSMITADDADFSSELEIILDEATYSPCGLCIDSKGRRIGWRVKAAKMIYDPRQGDDRALNRRRSSCSACRWPGCRGSRSPIPASRALSGFRLPRVRLHERRWGRRRRCPISGAIDDDTDLILTPRLMSRQGALLRRRGHAPLHATASPTSRRRASTSSTRRPSPAPWATGSGAARSRPRATSRHPETGRPAGRTPTFTDAAYLATTSSPRPRTRQRGLRHAPDARHLPRPPRSRSSISSATSPRRSRTSRPSALPKSAVEQVTDLPRGWGQVRLNGAPARRPSRGRPRRDSRTACPMSSATARHKVHGTVEATGRTVIAPGGSP